MRNSQYIEWIKFQDLPGFIACFSQAVKFNKRIRTEKDNFI
jgi:hypothetical protein